MKVYLALFALALALSAVPAVSGAGSQAATLDKLVVTPSSKIQGMGGEIELSVSAYFYGGCCYSLFANDVRPTVEVPDGLVIVTGPSPERIGSFTALAGGDPTLATFRYTLRCDSVGSFTINATVDTSDCGSRAGATTVHVIKGASIGAPEIHPESPTTDGDTYISFVSKYPVGDTKVVSASVYVHGSDSEIGSETMSAEMGSLHIGGKAVEDVTWIECDADPLEDGRFTARIPASSEHVYYWIVVIDENGKNTTSGVYHLDVEDTGKVRTFNLISWSVLVLGTAILTVSLILGQSFKGRFGIGKSMKGPLRYGIVGGIVLGAALIAAGILTIGNGAELFDHLLGGK